MRLTPHRLYPTAGQRLAHTDTETGTREAGKPPLPQGQQTHGHAELADLGADTPQGQDGFVRARFGDLDDRRPGDDWAIGLTMSHGSHSATHQVRPRVSETQAPLRLPGAITSRVTQGASG